MAKLSPNDPCPCGSGAKYKRCCRVYHHGAPAPTPEALMRSRYAAYALHLHDYVIATTDPTGPVAQPVGPWRARLEALARTTVFTGLEVASAEGDADEGFVTFHARYVRDGAPGVLSERSRFVRRGGRWLYHSGDLG